MNEWVVPPFIRDENEEPYVRIHPWKRISLDSRMSDANNIGQSKRNYDDEYDDNDDDVEERWRDGDGAGDDYDEIFAGRRKLDLKPETRGESWVSF